MDQDIFISKFDIKSEPVYAKITWRVSENELFHINLLHNNASWSGSYSIQTANKFRELADEDEILYQDNIKECLQNNSNHYILDFVIETSNTATFCWKKKFDGSTAVLIHGKVLLHRNEQTENKDKLIDILLDKNSELQQTIGKCKQDYEKLHIDLEKCKKELANFADLKISMESTLYSKFLQLLNVKKRRIQLLEDLLKKNEK